MKRKEEETLPMIPCRNIHVMHSHYWALWTLFRDSHSSVRFLLGMKRNKELFCSLFVFSFSCFFVIKKALVDFNRLFYRFYGFRDFESLYLKEELTKILVKILGLLQNKKNVLQSAKFNLKKSRPANFQFIIRN